LEAEIKKKTVSVTVFKNIITKVTFQCQHSLTKPTLLFVQEYYYLLPVSEN